MELEGEDATPGGRQEIEAVDKHELIGHILTIQDKEPNESKTKEVNDDDKEEDKDD